MPICKYVNIATKAYQQAVKYENISHKQREQLFHFIHDWFRQIEDENNSTEEGLESPETMFQNSMSNLGKLNDK